MENIINIGLIKNPLNWVIVLLMVVLFSVGADIVFKQFSSEKG